MIEVRGLSKSYGDRLAIDKLNFSVSKGEVVGFLGPNGAGKSTTMKIITGYMSPSDGEVKVAGFDVFSDPLEVKKRIGYLPETPPVYGDMKVSDYLKFVARIKGVEEDNVRDYVASAIKKTNLSEVENRLIQNLSKGFKQRVGIAQALVSDPEILILDEPTVGLDPKQVMEVRDLIRKLKGQHTIVLSTHIMSEVQANCDRVIIINRGKIVAEDTLSGLSKHLSSGSRVELKVRRGHDSLAKSLKGSEGVLNVQLSGAHLLVDIDGNENTLEALASQVVQQGCGLLEMRSQSASLEDIFIQLTSDKKGVNT